MAIRNTGVAVNAMLAQMNLKRSMRRPSHTFQLKYKPFALQPFMLAPVMPGETMTNLLVQCRAVSDPIRNKLVGWWNGMWFYYVKLSDLSDRDTITPIFTNFASDLSGLHSAANAKYNHAAGSVNWLEKCMEVIVDQYWRYEGEAWNVATIDGLPAAPVNLRNWTDSLLLTDDVVAEQPTELTVGVDDSVSAREIEDLMLDYQLQQMMGIGSDMSYEDWLRMYGVSVPKETVHKPELLRFIQQWTYPTNTVEPTDGSVASAVVWSHAERADKDRFFREPGFVVGIICARPKVYMKLSGNAADFMDDAKNWLPPFRINDPRVSEIESAGAAGPAAVIVDADGYKWDVRDLLMYGDQFSNYALTVGTDNALNLPEADGDKRYPVEADVNDLFVDETDTDVYIRADGICNLSIKTLQKDQSPTT